MFLSTVTCLIKAVVEPFNVVAQESIVVWFFRLPLLNRSCHSRVFFTDVHHESLAKQLAQAGHITFWVFGEHVRRAPHRLVGDHPEGEADNSVERESVLAKNTAVKASPLKLCC